MPLVHRHGTDGNKLPKITRPWAEVSAHAIGISTGGKTPLYTGGFAGCIGVAMCGKGPWGAMAHLHQNIQDRDQSLELALTILADFVNAHTKDKVREVLVYFGMAKHNLGQDGKLTAARIKEVMKCQSVIDLRLTKPLVEPYGNEFVYDPGLQIVYTAPAGTPEEKGGAGIKCGLYDAADKALTPAKSKFPYPASTEKLVSKGLGKKGWFVVP